MTMQVDKARLDEMLAGLEGVTPGPWWSDEDGGDEFRAYAVFGPYERYGKPSSICDTHNAGEVVLEQEDGKPWDEQGRKNLTHIARCDPDTMRSIITELLELRSLRSTEGKEEEPVAYLIDCPVEPCLEFADVDVPDAAIPLVRRADLEAAEAHVAKLREALEPFADVADHDIGEDEADSDTFQPMTNHNSAAKITVGDMRRARAALTRSPE